MDKNLSTIINNSTHEHKIFQKQTEAFSQEILKLTILTKKKKQITEDNGELTLDNQNESPTICYDPAKDSDMTSEDFQSIQELCYIKKLKIKDLLQVIRILLK